MYELKTKVNDASVLKFLNSVEDPQRRADSLEMLDIMSKITGEEPKMWGKSIIGFGSYTYKNSAGKAFTWMKIAFSPRKQNLTLYIMPGFKIYPELMNKLGPHKTGKGCLYLKKLSDANPKVLARLIKESYEEMGKKYPKAVF